MSRGRMTFDEVDRLVREANPVPDTGLVDDLEAPSFEDLVDRHVAMAALADEPVEGLRRPTVAALVAVSVVALVGILFAVTRVRQEDSPRPADRTEDEQQPTERQVEEDGLPPEGVEDRQRPDQTPADEAVALVEDYIAARNEHDPERAVGLVSDDFVSNERPPGYRGRATMELAFEFDRVFRAEQANASCRAGGSDSGAVRVFCDVDLSTAMHEVGGFPPERRRMIATVVDGRIVRTDSQIDSGRAGAMAAYEAWRGFLIDHHPEFVSVFDRSLSLNPQAVDRLVEEMPTYLDLYAAEVNDVEPTAVAYDYFAARNSYDLDRALGLVSDHFATNESPDGYVDRGSMEFAFAYHRAYEFKFSKTSCSAVETVPDDGDDPEGSTVACDYEHSTVIHRVGGFERTRGRLEMVIADNRIVSISNQLFGTDASPWDAWTGFLGADHPAFHQVVSEAGLLGSQQILDQLVAELPDHLERFEQWTGEQD